MKFRENALAKLNSRQTVESPIELASVRSWVALTLAAVIVAAGVIWSATGSLPRSINGQGVLTHKLGAFTLQSPTSGQIVGVFVATGSTFPKGAPLFSIATPQGSKTVRSITAGRVIATYGKVGEVIGIGDQIAVLERIEPGNDDLVAVLYVRAGDARQIQQGSDVDLALQSAPSDDFGVLRGVVESIGQFAETKEQISDYLGDPTLADRFWDGGQAIRVTVRILHAGTPSGYLWTTRNGPPFPIDSRTLINGSVVLPSIKPIEWMVP